MSKMTREQALIECRDLWIKIRDCGAKSCSAKADHLLDHQQMYAHNCPCCEYTRQHLGNGNVNCRYCPLLHLWKTPITESISPCLGDDSPYLPFEENRGTPEDADKIVQECQRLLDGGEE